MKAGILGLSASGKSTLIGSFIGKVEGGSHIGIVTVPDERVNKLSALYNPKKTTYATIQMEELPSIDTKVKEEKIKLFDKVKTMEVHILCIGGYRNYTVDDIVKEVEKLRFELVVNDLDVITKKMEKLEVELKKNPKMKSQREGEISLLKTFQNDLEEERFPSLEKLDDNLKPLLINYNFFTVKPSIYVINISQDQFLKEKEIIEEKIKSYLNSVNDNSPFLILDGQTESEIMDMDEKEIEEFLGAFGLSEPAKDRVIRKAYELLGLITFFTVGQDEVRAWNIHKGDNSVMAAGAIHSDLARGFIRAEVVEGETLLELGSINAAKSHGKLRLEGKTYIVKDGDVVNILFNI